MGRIASPARGRRRLTRWAFALDAVPSGVDDRVALVLAPEFVAGLPPLEGAWLGDAGNSGARSGQRRQVLSALIARACPFCHDVRLTVDSDGFRWIMGTTLYASVAERSGWVAAVVSHAPVGIDLESIAEGHAGATVVLDGVEAVDPADWHGLAGVWAAREATLKAMGRDLTRDPGGWRFKNGTATAAGGRAHRIDLVTLPRFVAAVSYVGD